MHNIKVIIGASYGDEGKGLATDFFGAGAAGQETINVLTNGGPQRGHTAELGDGRRHVFKHFGAATFRGAASYYAAQFMVNPMEFIREYGELSALHKAPEAYMHPRCRFTTPWDMLVNQLLLEKKGLHNSCGFGIWETVLRYQRGYGLPLSTFFNMNRDDRLIYLKRLRDSYFAGRLQELGISRDGGKSLLCPDGAGLYSFFFTDELLRHFEEDCESMRYLCPVRDDLYLRNYQTVLFENAQGLLLDGNSEKEKEFTTPSTTGAGKVLETVERVFDSADVEIVYVTRSYLTRHGDGSMENEIAEEQLADKLPGVRADLTNVENRFQGNLRYGMMDVNSLAERIAADFTRCTRAAGSRYRPSVMVTHLNEFADIDTDSLLHRFGTVYMSDGRTCRDIHRETVSKTITM